MADGYPVIQGQPGWATNRTQTPTQITNGASKADGTGLYLFSGSNGPGLYAVGRGANQPGVRSSSYNGDGIVGVSIQYEDESESAGVRGVSISPLGAGVHGWHPNATGVQGDGQVGVRGDGAYFGTIGMSWEDGGVGVEGDALGRGGVGVWGAADGPEGVGVYALAYHAEAVALQVNGRAVFNFSGRITVPAGATSGTQSGLALSTASFVIATLQEDLPGVLVRAAVPDVVAGSITVYLNQAPTVDATVGWMAVN